MSQGRNSYRLVKKLIREHEAWFSRTLPLVASENLASMAVREALSSDMGQRYAEGPPGDRIYAGCRYMDKVEEVAMDLARKLFGGDFVDVRPISGLIANLSVYSGLTTPGDTIVSLSTASGGHISSESKESQGTAGLVHGLRVEYFEYDVKKLNIDVDRSLKKMSSLHREKKSPKVVTFGASLFLFPHPLRDMVERIREIGATVLYDGAHVAGLIAGGEFQDPMKEGADLLTFSTHKTMFGPQGGMIVGRSEFREKVSLGVFPGTTSNHHPNLVAGKALALAELMEFGKIYARDVISNARALAEALSESGENVLGEALGFTRSHQVVLDTMKYGGGIKAEKLLESVNIITNRQSFPREPYTPRPEVPEGLRLGTSELTRLGFSKSDMKEVAAIIHYALNGGERERVMERVEEVRKGKQSAKYSFERSPAYFYR
ncbi:MAG: serine hydroxymethyltransferase [Nitrososphaerota archaeon]|nr:serine hydroxymethyltransferase [Nitrososphaerota archaeon]